MTIGDYYERIRKQVEIEQKKLQELIDQGASRQEIAKQREIRDRAGNTGD